MGAPSAAADSTISADFDNQPGLGSDRRQPTRIDSAVREQDGLRLRNWRRGPVSEREWGAYACPAASIRIVGERGPVLTFTITRDCADNPAVVRLAGELDMTAAPELNACIDELVAGGHRHLLLDLRDLTFCDSTGISCFVRGDNNCAARGGWLRLTGFTGAVERVLRVTGLCDFLAYDVDADHATVVTDQ
jgi:anti-anti-sigma factor